MQDRKPNGHNRLDGDFLFVEYCHNTHQLNCKLRKLFDLKELPFDKFLDENIDLLTNSFIYLIQEGVTHE